MPSFVNFAELRILIRFRTRDPVENRGLRKVSRGGVFRKYSFQIIRSEEAEHLHYYSNVKL